MSGKIKLCLMLLACLIFNGCGWVEDGIVVKKYIIAAHQEKKEYTASINSTTIGSNGRLGFGFGTVSVPYSVDVVAEYFVVVRSDKGNLGRFKVPVSDWETIKIGNRYTCIEQYGCEYLDFYPDEGR